MNEEIERYIDGGSAEQQALFAQLQALILSLYPDATIKLYYSLPTYKSEAGQVSLGYSKDGVSLYTTGAKNVEAFKAAQPKIKTNKASINFKLTDTLPEADVAGVVRLAMGD